MEPFCYLVITSYDKKSYFFVSFFFCHVFLKFFEGQACSVKMAEYWQSARL